jgi:hypothetical protein
LTVGQVGGNTTTTVSINSYTIGGITHSASQQVSIIYVAPPPTFTSLTISGPGSVNEASTAQYSATAWFSDGSSQTVNPGWSVNSAAISISPFGLLSAGIVPLETPVNVSANYTNAGIAHAASQPVNISVVSATVTPSAGSNGSISPNTSQPVNLGSNITFTATPTNGYVVDQWLLNAASVQNGGTTFTLSNVLMSAIVQVAFKVVISIPNTNADIVYVWCKDGTIQKINTNGVGSLFATNNLDGGIGPVGLTLNNVGDLYATSGSYIWKFSPDGNRSKVGALDSVTGVAFDNAGNLYATFPNYIEVSKLYYNPAFSAFGFTPSNSTSSHLSYPVNMAFDSADNLYVANNPNAEPSHFYQPSPYDNMIEEFSTNFTYIGTFATGLNGPSGMAYDSGGNLYVANSGTNGSLQNTIVKFTSGGVLSTFATASSGLNAPQGLAFDSAGNLYVANSGNGNILKFTPDGSSSVFASGLNAPTSIAIFPGQNVWSATAATVITLNNPKTVPSSGFKFEFNGNTGLAFTILATTNVSLSLSNWTIIGSSVEISPGQYQFTDPQATNGGQRFYRIRSN